MAAWVGIPTPLSLLTSSAGAAASTALSSTQAALSVAKSVSGQRETVDSKQAKTKVPVRVVPQDPGKGQLHIGTLTTTGDADVHPSIPVRTHIHHHQPDTDTTTRSGFSLPIGPVFDIHASLQALGGMLSPVEEVMVEAQAEAACDQAFTEVIEKPQTQGQTPQDTDQKRRHVRAFLADPEVKEAVKTLARTNQILVNAKRQEEAVGTQKPSSGSLRSDLPRPPQEAPSLSKKEVALREAQMIEDFVGSLGKFDSNRSILSDVAALAETRLPDRIYAVSRESLRAQGVISQACTRLAAQNPEAAGVVLQVAEGAIYALTTGLRIWGYTEAGLTGAAVGFALVAPPGALLGGATGLVGAYGVERTVSAGAEGIVDVVF